MRKKKRLIICSSLLVLSAFVIAGHASALGSFSNGSFDINGKNDRLNQAGLMPSESYLTKADFWPDKAEKPSWLAQADTEKSQ